MNVVTYTPPPRPPRLVVVPWWVALPFVLNTAFALSLGFVDRHSDKDAQITELATSLNNTEQALLRCVEAQSDLAKSIDKIASE